MFEPKSHWEKRAALTENLVQALLQTLPPQVGQKIFAQWAMNIQGIKDSTALSVLNEGKPGIPNVDENLIADPFFTTDLLRHNFGPTFFKEPNAKFIPEGQLAENAIGTAGFGTKWKDWVASLPMINDAMGPGLSSGFYNDGNSNEPSVLVALRHDTFAGPAITLLGWHGGDQNHQVLFLDHMDHKLFGRGGPEWRTEMVSYYGQVTKADYAVAFGRALQTQGITDIRLPSINESEDAIIVSELAGATVNFFAATQVEVPGLEKVEEAAAALVEQIEAAPSDEVADASTEAAPVEYGRGQNPVFVAYDDSGYASENEVATEEVEVVPAQVLAPEPKA